MGSAEWAISVAVCHCPRHLAFPRTSGFSLASLLFARRMGPNQPILRKGAAMSAKRNLLLGMLALQNNRISRAQLLAAFNAWIEDKGQSLGALLLRQRALTAEHLALLEALAAAHLGHHGDDRD